MTAQEALLAVAKAALASLDGVRVYDGPPVRASVPYAVVEIGPETDWGHKSGIGREGRLAVTLRDKSETPARLRRLMGEAEGAIAGIGAVTGWSLVTLHYLRGRVVREGTSNAPQAWAGVIEFRVRMLAAGSG